MKVLVVDDDQERAKMVETALRSEGYEVDIRPGSTTDFCGVLQSQIERSNPDIIIIDLDSPNRDTIEHMRTITAERPRPIVMFAEEGEPETIRDAVAAGVSAYVVKGLQSDRVRPVVDVAIARFREIENLRGELRQAQQSLVDRKAIERAKGLLMSRRGYDEETAYKAMRNLAMDRNMKLIDVARSIIAAADLLV
jgi:response regulator NasT